MKYVSLCVLSLQTAAHVVLTRYSRANEDTSQYLASTVVSIVEVLKLFISFIVVLTTVGMYSIISFGYTFCLSCIILSIYSDGSLVQKL